MAFDGGFLKKVIDELKSACDCHIDKIYQPTRDQLIFSVRKKGFVKKVLISVRPGSSRIQFTENKYENPQNPPMFCMLIRKYLSSSRLIDIIQPGLERVAEFILSSTNEMGDNVNFRLICEFIGNQSNIILVNENGKIIEALKHSDVENNPRMILPGAIYEYPKKQDKLNPLLNSTDFLCDIINKKNSELSKNILDTIDGFSPLICREIEYKASLNNLNNILSSVLDDLNFLGHPLMLIKEDGSPFDFTYTDISQYEGKLIKKSFNTYSEMLDYFYYTKDNTLRIHHEAQDILKLVNNLKNRTQRKLSLRLQDLKKCADREKLRIYGELLKSNLYNISVGSSFADVQNYYDENLQVIRIPLNPALSPQSNAAKYFKEYKKSYTAEQTLKELTKQDEEELVYLDSVTDAISRCTLVSEIDEIREELNQAGYTKKSQNIKRNKAYKPVLKEFVSDEGYKILVGKNNRQNDYITTKLSSKNDLWFHVKNIPGSHVVIFNGGLKVSDNTILYAAALAAYNSKAQSSSQVPVDYTIIKNVKKPNGAKPGMVIYTTNKTIYVTPKEDIK